MNALDVALLIGALLALIGGWRLGFVHRLGGWLGLAVATSVAVMALPSVIDGLGIDNDPLTFTVGGLFVIGLASLGQAIGASIGSRLRSGMNLSGIRVADSIGGALLGLLGTVAVVWLLFPIMAGAQGWPSRLARSSSITRQIAQVLPPPPSQVDSLVRQLSGGHFPTLFDRLTPAPDAGDPPTDVDFDAGVYARATASVVRIEAPACGRIQTGSGFVVNQDLVVTNAHVVAGSERTSVTSVDGHSTRATVIHFDPAIDLAVLRAPIDADPLSIAAPTVGDKGLVMGFPGGGPFAPSPFVISRTIRANGRDIYDRAPVRRDLLILGSDLAPGDSGSAVLLSDGSVVGVAVAIAPDSEAVAYALDSSELRKVLNEVEPGPASTGPCR